MSFRGDDFMSIALRRGIEFWVQVMRVGKRFAAEFGEVRVERIECDGIGWTDNRGSVTTIEGYSMAESKSSLDGEGRGEFKVRND